MPSDIEFGILVNVAGKKLKSKNGWIKEVDTEDSFGFSAFPAGFRSYDLWNGKRFVDFGSVAFMWSSTENAKKWAETTSSDAYAFSLSDKGLMGLAPKQRAMPVRCIKDEE